MAAAHNLALTATGLVALAFHLPFWAADLLIMTTACCLDGPLAMAAGGAASSAYHGLLVVVVVLAGAVSFFVAILRLHLALICPTTKVSWRKAVVLTAALAVPCVVVVLVEL